MDYTNMIKLQLTEQTEIKIQTAGKIRARNVQYK